MTYRQKSNERIVDILELTRLHTQESNETSGIHEAYAARFDTVCQTCQTNMFLMTWALCGCSIMCYINFVIKREIDNGVSSVELRFS